MDYCFISEKITKVYVDCNIRTFPINCFDIIAQYGYRIFTYSDLREKNSDLFELCISCSDEAYQDSASRIVAYNERKPPNRISFTLAHELGHIALDTLVEDEADTFASNFLAPRIAIHKMNCRTADQIHDTFGLSYEASNRALFSYKKWYQNICWTTRQPSAPELQLEQILFPSHNVAGETEEVHVDVLEDAVIKTEKPKEVQNTTDIALPEVVLRERIRNKKKREKIKREMERMDFLYGGSVFRSTREGLTDSQQWYGGAI